MSLDVVLNRTTTAGIVVLAVILGCGEDSPQLALTVVGAADMKAFDLQVKGLDDGRILLQQLNQAVTPAIDPSEGIRLGFSLDRPGTYLVFVRGYAKSGPRFLIKQYVLDRFVEDRVEMVRMGSAQDADGDGFPRCGTYADRCPPMSAAHFDCDDKDKSVHPFASEACGDGKDNDCSAGCGASAGKGDATCKDTDGDGATGTMDCDESHPCRSFKLKEAGNLCTTKQQQFPVLPGACLTWLKVKGKTMAPPYCGDGVDQDCSGKDESCLVDQDCDGYSPPADCNDKDRTVNPGAEEVCGDGVDNNCNLTTDEGCAACDVDGDGYPTKEAKDQGVCTDKAMLTRANDPDDFDAGVFPTVSKANAGKEGGPTVAAALRQFCSGTIEAKNSTAAKRVYNRDIDHDGDGSPASEDGCPKAVCDVDGDGFMKRDAAKGCTPRASETDCDDKDARVFPGAPDVCGDGKAQNCGADRPCTGDSDGDGYFPPLDCNDKDKAIHPWAAEACNATDDDCDGLVDEGNPSADGKSLVPTNVNRCNDSNKGVCGSCSTKNDPNCDALDGLSGICVCSPRIPAGYTKNASGAYLWPDPKDRTVCSGESLGKTASPRCFGATQRSLEQCDRLDHNCDGTVYKLGESFVGRGKVCGKTVRATKVESVCTAGTVTACRVYDDATKDKKVPHYDLVKAFDPGYVSPYWVCSGVLPWPEVCNGKDDNCDGKAEAYDLDQDADKFIDCSKQKPPGCTYSQSRYALATSLRGCADCADKDKTIYPTAKEMCDGVDNNCKTGDEGKDECSPKGQTCCPSKTPPRCVDLKTSQSDCGSCGNDCGKLYGKRIDGCEKGTCACGTSGGPCGEGVQCGTGGACVCLTGSSTVGSCPTGCCTANRKACVKAMSQSASACGLGGIICKICDDKDPCTKDSCVFGMCFVADAPDFTACTSGGHPGTCKNRACCTGCWNGGKCEPGTSHLSCGVRGAACQDCSRNTVNTQCASGLCVKP